MLFQAYETARKSRTDNEKNAFFLSPDWHLYCPSTGRSDFGKEEYRLMKPRKVLAVTISAATLVVWGSAWAQTARQTAGQSGGTPPQYPTTGTQNPAAPGGPTTVEAPESTPPASMDAQKADQKEKHWSGALVT
jgi:hypothetical protein